MANNDYILKISILIIIIIIIMFSKYSNIRKN